MAKCSDTERAELCEAMVFTAKCVLEGDLSILHGGRKLFYLAQLLGLDEKNKFEYLWALRSDCSELCLDESDRFNRHPDLLARKDKRFIETTEFYKDKVLDTCRYILGSRSWLDSCENTPNA